MFCAMALPAAILFGAIIFVIPLIFFLIGYVAGLVKRLVQRLSGNRNQPRQRKYPYVWLLILSVAFTIGTLCPCFYAYGDWDLTHFYYDRLGSTPLSTALIIISATLWFLALNPFRVWLMRFLAWFFRPELRWPMFILGIVSFVSTIFFRYLDIVGKCESYHRYIRYYHGHCEIGVGVIISLVMCIVLTVVSLILFRKKSDDEAANRNARGENSN